MFGIWHHFYNSPFNVVAVQVFAKWTNPKANARLDPEATLQAIYQRFQPVPLNGTYWISLQALAMNALHQQYRKAAGKRRLLLALFVLALALSFITDLSTGASALGWRTILAGLADDSVFSTAQRVIFWDVRLPYAVMALLVGASLGLAGAEMQTRAQQSARHAPSRWAWLLRPRSAPRSRSSSTSTPWAWAAEYSVPLAAFACAAGVTVLIQLMARSYGAGADTHHPVRHCPAVCV